jgi:hypothetical protein
MCSKACLTLAALAGIAFLPGLGEAATVSLTGGTLTMNLDRAAWASTNGGTYYAAAYNGTDQPAPGMYLEEFLDNAHFGPLLPNQWNAYNLVPGLGEIPSTGLQYGVNGPSVTNGVGHHNQPTTFSFDPANPAGTASGAIGLDGTMKFRGNFQSFPGQSMFLLGEFSLFHDVSHAVDGASGWVIKGNITPAMPVFDLLNVATALNGNLWTLAGDLRLTPEVANSFFDAEIDGPKILGNVSLQVTTTAPVPLPAAVWLFGGALSWLGLAARRRS